MSPSLSLQARFFDRTLDQGHGGHNHHDLRLPLAETALLLIDVDGPGYSPGEPTPVHANPLERETFVQWKKVAVERIAPALHAARALGLRVVYVSNAWPGKNWPQTEFGGLLTRVLGTQWTQSDEAAAIEFSSLLKPRDSEAVVHKTMYDGFHETSLDLTLRSRGTRNIICAGFDTAICVLGTSIGALNRNYKVVVLRDATAAAEFHDTQEQHGMAAMGIRLIECSAGYTLSTDQFIQACKAAQQAST